MAERVYSALFEKPRRCVIPVLGRWLALLVVNRLLANPCVGRINYGCRVGNGRNERNAFF